MQEIFSMASLVWWWEINAIITAYHFPWVSKNKDCTVRKSKQVKLPYDIKKWIIILIWWSYVSCKYLKLSLEETLEAHFHGKVLVILYCSRSSLQKLIDIYPEWRGLC